MQGELTEYGTQFECIIDDEIVIAYQRGDRYLAIDRNGQNLWLTERQVIAGIQAKTAMDVEEYNQHAPQAAVSRGGYYGD